MKKDKEIKMLAGMQTEIEALRYAISTIAEIIWMEMPLRYQDQWLENIMAKGIWRPDPEMEEGAKKEIEE